MCDEGEGGQTFQVCMNASTVVSLHFAFGTVILNM